MSPMPTVCVASGEVRAKMLGVEFRRHSLLAAAHHQHECQHKDVPAAIQQLPFQSGAQIGSNCPDTTVRLQPVYSRTYFDTQ